MDPKAPPFASSSSKGKTANSGAPPSEVEWEDILEGMDHKMTFGSGGNGPKASDSSRSGSGSKSNGNNGDLLAVTDLTPCSFLLA
ncbi:uncharacterized protein RSE6_14623 [Rhynchosporium secalis]|uniref:Uncharacterized protein n=1 Tax=Rhynchosporium secalis TaxID=38038 RepID=A0A1E1MVR8_RHYSE|nr:uncharacterized protein RSE6_14623 [Rhynchosporium secalis]